LIRVRKTTIVAAGVFGAAATLLPLALAQERPDARDDRVWLGVLIDDQSLDGGIQLIAVVPGGPAAMGGLQRGDVLLEVEGRGLARSEDLEHLLSRYRPGDRLRLRLLRAGRPQDRAVELTRRPSGSWNVLPVPPDAASPPLPPLPAATVLAEPAAAAFGMVVTDVTPDLRTHYGAPEEVGVLVTEVHPGRAADRAGVRVGDVLVQLGSVGVQRAAEVDDLLWLGRALDEVIEARLIRDNRWSVVRLAVPRLSQAESDPAQLTHAVEQFDSLERAIQREIERLRARLEEYERRLDAVREARETENDR
jgi:serine protease Do